jgi:ABC-type Fe3+/spermidine/putrescine transport system ATPase subunit
VAEFTGTSNLMEVEVVAYDPHTSLLTGSLKGNRIILRSASKPMGRTVTILLRPEWIKIAKDENESSANLFSGQVVTSTFMGFMVKYQVKAFEGRMLALEVQDPQEHEIKKEGETLYFRFNIDRPVVITS